MAPSAYAAGPVQRFRVPYARALYAAALAALLSACTEPELAPSADRDTDQTSMVATTVDSTAANGELPVVVVSASRPLPEIVVTASRVREDQVGTGQGAIG
jgi:hypothetical protein